MSKTIKAPAITRTMRIEETGNAQPKNLDNTLKTITQNFQKENLSRDQLEKKWRQMNETSKRQEEISSTKSTKRSKKQEDKAIFLDIFIKPKEQKLKEIAEKRSQNQKEQLAPIEEVKQKTYISNKLCADGKILGMNNTSTQSNFDFKRFTTSSLNFNAEEADKTKITTFLNENIISLNLAQYLKAEKTNDVKILNKYLHEKYILNRGSSELSKKNYFNQLIQIRTPEGINAVVASPLMDSKGWAPSIPSVNIDKLNTNLNDLMTRAKGGIEPGNLIKEAHMAFYLGIMNEEEKKYETALKFYKKYFLSAKLLQDIYGTELALNRIAVLFSNIYDYKQSIYYNEKHKEITTHNLNAFVAFYNCGVCHRILEQYDESIKNFEKALKLSEDEDDLESYTLCLAQLAISHIFLGNVADYIEHSEQFFKKNKALNHVEMGIEMMELCGYIYNFCSQLDQAKTFYENSLVKAEDTGDERSVSLSLCNIGIIEAEKDFDTFLGSLEEKEEEEDQK